MKSITLSEKDIARFWSKVKIGSPDECWEWQACTFNKSYGLLQLKNGATQAHRISWTIEFGVIQEDMCVCHKCDNTKCVNPDHLFLGTVAENNQDRAKKGRSGDSSGEKNPGAKLKKEDVLEIRILLSQKISQRKIAKKFGVGKTAIARIFQGTHWKGI